MRRGEEQSPGAIWLAAVDELADTLETENRVLLALDFTRVAATLAAKQRAIAAATGVAGLHALSAPEQAEARELAARLSAAAAENRRLLEHAMAVQRRLIALVVRAARTTAPAASRAPRYGVGGAILAGVSSPMALSARA